MKVFYLLIALMAQRGFASSGCDIKLGLSVGVRVIEYVSGNVIHSKIPLKEVSVQSLNEEMASLHEMGICDLKTPAKRCVLKFEKRKKDSQLTMFRGEDRWISWPMGQKIEAQKFVKTLQLAGYCS